MTTHLPDCQMQHLLQQARRYSSNNENITRKSVTGVPLTFKRKTHDEVRRTSSLDLQRRLSEAGVNRRPSSANILTEDTDSFIIGDLVYVDGVKPGRIQFIGETKFASGDWAGVFLDEPLGKNDGSVMNNRYFQCDKNHGVFSRLFRLTSEPIEGASEILNQMRWYGYDVVQDDGRRESVSTAAGSRRGSHSDDHRSSLSPIRFSPDNSPIRRHSGNVRVDSTGSRYRRISPRISPLASSTPSHIRFAKESSMSLKSIEKDPNIGKLASEARRLSMGGNARRTSSLISDTTGGYRQPSATPPHPPSRKTTPPVLSTSCRRSISIDLVDSGSNHRHDLNCAMSRLKKPSSELSELEQRRLSEAGISRRSSDVVVLNERTDSLMIGMPVWVDGVNAGRIAYIGEVHFAKGVLAGVHLVMPLGKNNGTVGGQLYFQCDPKHGIFSRLHRLTTQPVLLNEEEEEV